MIRNRGYTNPVCRRGLSQFFKPAATGFVSLAAISNNSIMILFNRRSRRLLDQQNCVIGLV
ncbi:MAG: hypothetical protein KME19_02460 [Microcoleus vaginatus WJT46-NPBG5]|nr:hypothetical protein [Microcoleus vaginatus WJT46-NPBG5]